jgi:hypothetical protein
MAMQFNRTMMRKPVGSPARSGQVKALDTYRATYNSLKKRFAVGKSNVIITPGYLRSEQVLGTQNQVSFPILVNEGTAPRSTERRLGISDTFVITDLGIRIGRLTGAAPQATPGPIQLESFVNNYVFTVVAEQAALHTFYNGALSVKVGSITYIEALDMLRFQQVGTAQRGLSVLAANPYSASEVKGLSDLADIVPTIQFSGQEKNIVQVTLPESAAMGAVAPAQNVAVFYARGFLCQNAAPLLNR